MMASQRLNTIKLHASSIIAVWDHEYQQSDYFTRGLKELCEWEGVKMACSVDTMANYQTLQWLCIRTVIFDHEGVKDCWNLAELGPHVSNLEELVSKKLMFAIAGEEFGEHPHWKVMQEIEDALKCSESRDHCIVSRMIEDWISPQFDQRNAIRNIACSKMQVMFDQSGCLQMTDEFLYTQAVMTDVELVTALEKERERIVKECALFGKNGDWSSVQ